MITDMTIVDCEKNKFTSSTNNPKVVSGRMGREVRGRYETGEEKTSGLGGGEL